MPKTDLIVAGIGNSVSHVSVEPEKVCGLGGVECPQLLIPIEMPLTPQESGGGNIRHFTIQSMKFMLFCGDVKIGETFNPAILNNSWYGMRHLVPVRVEIQLDRYKIKRIEDIRASQHGDITFVLKGEGLAALHPNVHVSESPKKAIEEYGIAMFNLPFTIPKSQWTRILPEIGYGKIALIEIPLPELIESAELKGAQTEVVKANEYFILGDYDKTVGHCRLALEPIKKKTLPEDLRKVLESDSKYEWLESLCSKTYELSSRTHHPSKDIDPTSSIGHFARFEAQSVLMVTTAIISYIAKILTNNELGIKVK